MAKVVDIAQERAIAKLAAEFSAEMEKLVALDWAVRIVGTDGKVRYRYTDLGEKEVDKLLKEDSEGRTDER